MTWATNRADAAGFFPGAAVDPDRCGSGLVDAVRAIVSREVSSRELVGLAIERIEESTHNAVITVDAERALAEAERRDVALAAGAPPGPLHGAPFTVKDAVATAGMRTTAGAPEMSDYVPERDATGVRLLREAGAVLVGKTNCSTWCSDLETANAVFGTTRNPWDPERTSGGSSGGSAVAVAAGLTSFELGTDIGGSVRIPSAFCGVFGLKPSFGVVPGDGYVDTPAGPADPVPDMNVLGPIAHTASDLGLLLDVLTGPSSCEEAAWSLRLPAALRAVPQGLRVTVLDEHPVTPTDPVIVAAVRQTADVLADAGAVVTRLEPPVPLDDVHAGFSAAVRAETALSHPAAPEFDARAVVESRRMRARQRAMWQQWFTMIDVVICPATPTLAFRHDQTGPFRTRVVTGSDGVARPGLTLMAWTGMASSLHLPAAVLPAGTHEGLPVGVQLVGPRFADRTLVAVAEFLSGAYR